jgi:penicillin-binding protein 2
MRLFGDRRRWRSELEKPEPTRGTPSPAIFAFLRALVILMFGILTVQLINLQVIQGDEFQERAEINALRTIPVLPARGLIFDRNGTPLVQNDARFSVAIMPGDLPEEGEAGVYRALSRVIGMPVDEIERLVDEGIDTQGEYSPARIKQDLDRDTALTLMELEPHAPGLQVLVEPSRRYLTGSLLPHVLGYVGPLTAEEFAELDGQGYLFQDFVGKTGVELSYESILRGKLGQRFVEVDSAGRELNVISERPPVDGSNIVLTIDWELQQVVAQALQEAAGDGQNAAAAVMDVRTGELLAMASMPTYDSNIFSSPLSPDQVAALTDSPGKPLVNHLIAERYAPGSTFKTIVGAAALQEGVARPDTVITSRGYITVENELDPNVVYVYPDWSSLGRMDFARGLAMSSNVYYYYLAGGKADEGFRGLGEQRLADYARAFGLGDTSGIDLPGESDGLVPDGNWKQATLDESWSIGDTYNFGIGQGYLASTPLQILTSTAAIANGGHLLTPHVVREVRDGLGNTLDTIDPQERSIVPVSDDNLQIVRQAMRQGVIDGLARGAAVPGIEVAGKTGTAEYGELQPNGKHNTHGWFVGFAPYNDPQVAVVVFTEHGTGDTATPVAQKILDYYFNHTRFAQAPETGAP